MTGSDADDTAIVGFLFGPGLGHFSQSDRFRSVEIDGSMPDRDAGSGAREIWSSPHRVAAGPIAWRTRWAPHVGNPRPCWIAAEPRPDGMPERRTAVCLRRR